MIFCNIGILCFYDGVIVNTDNGITYNGRSNVFLTSILDMSLNRLSKILYDWLGWNMYEIEITWRMMQIEVNSTCYVSVPIYSEKSVNSMSEFANINGMNILNIYLNSRLRRENSSSTEFTLVPTYYQRTTLASQAIYQDELDAHQVTKYGF
jgi:hypothetical protein